MSVECFSGVFSLCVSSGDGRGRPVQRGGRPASPPPQPVPVSSASFQHSGGPAGGAADTGAAQLNRCLYIMCLTCELLLSFLFVFFGFLLSGLEGRLPPQSCDLTFHQSGKARGNAAQPAYPLRVDGGVWKQRWE